MSGVQSWRQLADRGIWVEGCGDNLGFETLTATLACPVLQLPALEQWTTLTHARAVDGWADVGVGRVIATYELSGQPAAEDLDRASAAIGAATHFFWGSIDQYKSVERWLPGDAQHACGAGKTARALRQAGVASLQVFPSRREWQAWLN